MIIGEEGTLFEGERTEVAKDAPMLENEIYEFYYVVHTLGDRWPLDKIRSFVLSKFTELMAQFRGLKVIYWKLTDTELIWQGKGISTSTWKELALVTVAIAAQGLLLAIGVIIALRTIFRIIETVPPVPKPRRYWWIWGLAGLALLAIIFGIGYAKGKEESK